MKTCVIFCAGGFEKLSEPIRDTDLVIAADGGLHHLEALGRKPDIILGDFDSLGYVPQGAQVFPVKKDDTDSMLAVRKGLSLGYRRFVLYGALDGPRLDHTVANLQTLCFLKQQGAVGYLAGKSTMATAISNEIVTFPTHATGIISLFCMGEDAQGVTIKGLQYTMENGTLTSAFPLGVSNHFTAQQATVHLHSGTLIALYDVENGFLL